MWPAGSGSSTTAPSSRTGRPTRWWTRREATSHASTSRGCAAPDPSLRDGSLAHGPAGERVDVVQTLGAEKDRVAREHVHAGELGRVARPLVEPEHDATVIVAVGAVLGILMTGDHRHAVVHQADGVAELVDESRLF